MDKDIDEYVYKVCWRCNGKKELSFLDGLFYHVQYVEEQV